MGIFKKPKILITAGAAVLLVVALVLTLVFLLQPSCVGIFGIDASSEEGRLMQAHLEEDGYEVLFAEELQVLSSTDCAAWIVRAETDEIAGQALEVAGEKVLFIDRRPNLGTPVRFMGYHMQSAGEILAQLISLLPLGGDSNEDGTVSCLVLAGPSGWDSQQWQKGLDTGMVQSQIPIQIVETLTGDYTEETAKVAVTQILAQYGRDIEVILASSEVLAEGAAKAISGRGWTQGQDFFLLSTGSLEKLDGRSGMAYIQEERYYRLLCDAIADTISNEPQKEYLLPFHLMNNSAPLQ